MNKLCFLIVISLACASCSTSKTKLTSGTGVEVLNSQPGKKCSVVAKVEGINEKGSVDLARNHARNQAGNEGADAITFDEEINNAGTWRVMATGYRCH